LADEVAKIEAEGEKEVAVIKAEGAKEVAAIEATGVVDASEASAFMTTLDKLQEFKRYTLAVAVLLIWGSAIALMGIGILVLIWKGQYEMAIEASKWLIALVGMSVTGILGFYFGSNAVSLKAG